MCLQVFSILKEWEGGGEEKTNSQQSRRPQIQPVLGLGALFPTAEIQGNLSILGQLLWSIKSMETLC